MNAPLAEPALGIGDLGGRQVAGGVKFEEPLFHE